MLTSKQLDDALALHPDGDRRNHMSVADWFRSRDIERDAERYRYLRDRAGNEIMRRLMDECRPDEWDKLIDSDRHCAQGKSGDDNGN